MVERLADGRLAYYPLLRHNRQRDEFWIYRVLADGGPAELVGQARNSWRPPPPFQRPPESPFD
jgi:hypothetical protein